MPTSRDTDEEAEHPEPWIEIQLRKRLEEAQDAAESKDWDRVFELAGEVLSREPGHITAADLITRASEETGREPPEAPTYEAPKPSQSSTEGVMSALILVFVVALLLGGLCIANLRSFELPREFDYQGEPPGPMMPTPGAGTLEVASLDGLACVGNWANLTAGSGGSFEAAFTLEETREPGTLPSAGPPASVTGMLTLTLGGNVFGGSGGTVELPFAIRAEQLVIDAPADFLGHARLMFESDGRTTDAVFESPPAFGSNDAYARLTGFFFDAEVLAAAIELGPGDGSTAKSVVDAQCEGSPVSGTE